MLGQPIALVLNKHASRLYATMDNTDGVVVPQPRTMTA